MNIHPLFVHFPIGLLVFYALLELLWFKRDMRESEVWFSIRAALSLAGAFMSYLTIITGEMAEKAVLSGGHSDLIETHSSFGVATSFIFSLLALAYLVSLLEKRGWNILKPLLSFRNIVLQTPVAPILALLGLILITITGALGASIVYGPDIDPFVKVIYGFFF